MGNHVPQPQRLEESHQTSEYVRGRVAVLALVWMLIGAVGTVVQITGDLLQGRVNSLFRGSSGWSLLGLVGVAALCLAARRFSLRTTTIYRLEALAVGVFALGVTMAVRGLTPDFVAGMAHNIDLQSLPAESRAAIVALARHYGILTLTFAFALILISHAALVPGTLRHTGMLSVVLVMALFCGMAPELLAHPDSLAFTAGDRVSLVSNIAVWWGFATLVSLVITHVIHTLRVEVKEARRLGQYVLEERIGAGGMGIVYRARHSMMRRPTAVKLLSRGRGDKEALRRFEQEVQLTARLSHPNTITIFDYGRTPDNVFYYAMELLDGASVQQVVDLDGAQSSGRVLHVIGAVADALIEAHELGLVHRDIKPGNIVLARYGGHYDFPKVLDFGLVRVQTDVARTGDDGQKVEGTPLYMAPEAITSPSKVDGRTDIYALGAVAYFMLTGTHVFEAKTVIEVCAKHLQVEPDPPSQRLGRDCAPDVEALVLMCLAKDPNRRPQTARDLAIRVRACEDSGTWTQAQACAWWQEHGSALEQRRQTEPMSPSAISRAPTQ